MSGIMDEVSGLTAQRRPRFWLHACMPLHLAVLHRLTPCVLMQIKMRSRGGAPLHNAGGNTNQGFDTGSNSYGSGNTGTSNTGSYANTGAGDNLNPSSGYGNTGPGYGTGPGVGETYTDAGPGAGAGSGKQRQTAFNKLKVHVPFVSPVNVLQHAAPLCHLCLPAPL